MCILKDHPGADTKHCVFGILLLGNLVRILELEKGSLFKTKPLIPFYAQLGVNMRLSSF